MTSLSSTILDNPRMKKFLASLPATQRIALETNIFNIEGGLLVRHIRQNADGGAGISQAELGKRIGKSRKQVSRVERGDRVNLPATFLIRAADVCGLKIAIEFKQRKTGQKVRLDIDPETAAPSPT